MASAREALKRLPDTISPRFIVDGFSFQRPELSCYFLTHYHGDHTVGLNASFSAGTIYCSPVTAALVVAIGLVDPKVVVVLAVDETSLVEGVEERAMLALGQAVGSLVDVSDTRAKKLKLCGWWDDSWFVSGEAAEGHHWAPL
ncbi:hypothetical protein T492DRAFT_876446 [Pavlovales sp. CCMP2436]|nr:hypothetical protein T492DRAFT_876446 [Pavlovales sp. CCMP2436]